jgi:glycosyltransferase involved in cell wall biosynthesis
MQISLCVICGNEQEIIERLLASFSDGFDELSLTRATGSTPPDATVDRARAWCEAHGKAFVFSEYRNAPGPELTHIDDFAAARNLAFEMATGEWLVWADCDDLIDNAALLREVLNAPERAGMVRFPYDVVGTGKTPMRERAIRAELFGSENRWQFAVHENLRVNPDKVTIEDCDSPTWIHQPKSFGTTNRKRNKAILSRTLAHSSANYFYVHQEWFCEGNKRNAEKFGKLALEFPDLEPSFRYEANLNLCRLASDPDDALRYGLAAHAVFPWCREALAALVLTFIDRKDNARALWFAEKLDATPLPPVSRLPWTHEPKWYGWAGNDLLSRAMRLSERHDEALVVARRDGAPVVSLIHATRGRPAQAGACRNTWLSLAANPGRVQYVFCVDSDDAKSVQYAKQFESVISDAGNCVAAWNAGAAASNGELLVQLSDDWLPVPGWDAKLLDAIKRAGKSLNDSIVVAVGDGHRTDDLLCMAICTRERWRQQGEELFSPEYESVYSDNEFSHRAFNDGVVVDARKEIVFAHNHPAFGTADMDETYARQNSKERYAKGEATFRRRNPDAQ